MTSKLTFVYLTLYSIQHLLIHTKRLIKQEEKLWKNTT